MIQNFDFKTTVIPGLIEITPFHAADERGCFIKDYAQEIFAKHDIKHELKEIFYTASHKGVIRGLHFQREKQQAKLVRCLSGHIYDVVADLRDNSSAKGIWLGFDLTQENRKELLIPCGCAHGFLALEESLVAYKCNQHFYPEYDDGIRWDDSVLDVKWPLEKIGGKSCVILSDKDKKLQSYKEFQQNCNGFMLSD